MFTLQLDSKVCFCRWVKNKPNNISRHSGRVSLDVKLNFSSSSFIFQGSCVNLLGSSLSHKSPCMDWSCFIRDVRSFAVISGRSIYHILRTMDAPSGSIVPSLRLIAHLSGCIHGLYGSVIPSWRFIVHTTGCTRGPYTSIIPSLRCIGHPQRFINGPCKSIVPS